MTLLNLTGLHLSTGGTDNTTFVLANDGTDLVFGFSAIDTTPCTREQIASKRDLEFEDRVELYLSPTADLSQSYFCIEIDRLGRVLDYRADYYRRFDFAWHFDTLRVAHAPMPDGYRIDGRVALSELVSLGIDPTRFHIGVFRADLDETKNLVAWGSATPMNDPPDFHRPEMFLGVTA